MVNEYLIPARMGLAIAVKQGQTVRIIDVEGEQVADFAAYQRMDHSERLDPSVTMDALHAYVVGQDDVLYSNKYRPMFTITRDLVQCHDLLNSACRAEMYEFLYQKSGHRSCYENLNEAFGQFGVSKPDQHYTLNIFMNTELLPDGQMLVKRPKSKPGDFIDLRAEMDVIVGISACPCEESIVNGYVCTPLRVQVH